MTIGFEGDTEAQAEDLIAEVESAISDRLRRQRNQARLRAIDAKKDSTQAVDSLSASSIEALPQWVKEEIESAVLVGKSQQVVQLPDGRKYHLLNRLNDLSGAEWTFFLNSVIRTRFSTTGPESFAFETRRIHPSPKPPQLMKAVIEFFTKERELVLDFFMGVGGTLLGASLANRRAVGVDLNPEYVDAYKRAASQLGLSLQPAYAMDSVALLKTPDWRNSILGGEDVALILIDPPYGDMMSRPKTGERAKSGLSTDATPYSTLKTDLGNMDPFDSIDLLAQSVSDARVALKSRGHVVIFMKDLQPTADSPNLLHAEVISRISQIPDLSYLGMKIWADESVNLYPYGYPHAFVSNQIHQYILVFRKA